VESEVYRFVKHLYRGSDIKVSLAQLPPQARGDVRIKTMAFRKVPDASGDGICLVGIEAKNGTETNAYVPFRVLVKRKLFTARRAIPKGMILRPADIDVNESYLQGGEGLYPSTMEEVAGKQAKREIRAGEVISNRLLDAVMLVQKGGMVGVVAESGSLLVRGTGTALDSAGPGDMVRVRAASGRELVGRVTPGGTVSVEF
jgi:flagella basal body P-ring formation protein FlgA